MTTPQIETKTQIRCPECGSTKQEDMPTDNWQVAYDCTSCGATLKRKEDDCCVFCSYGDTPCPSVQAEAVR